MKTKFIIPLLLLCLSGGSCKKENNGGNTTSTEQLYHRGGWGFWATGADPYDREWLKGRFYTGASEIDTPAKTLTGFALYDDSNLRSKMVVRFPALPIGDTVYAPNDTAIHVEVSAAIEGVANGSLVKYLIYPKETSWRVNIDDNSLYFHTGACLAVSTTTQDTLLFSGSLIHYFGVPEPNGGVIEPE